MKDDESGERKDQEKKKKEKKHERNRQKEGAPDAVVRKLKLTSWLRAVRG